MSFKPVRPSFIFRTQMKIFLMNSESCLTLHRQQHNWHVPRLRNVARTSVKQSIWHQGFNRSFTKLGEYFEHKENKNTFIQQFVSSASAYSAILENIHWTYQRMQHHAERFSDKSFCSDQSINICGAADTEHHVVYIQWIFSKMAWGWLRKLIVE